MADFPGVLAPYGPPVVGRVVSVYDGVLVLPSTSPAVQYYQRVWSTGTAEWCYYVQAAINPAPTPAETTPNWVGSAIDHNVIAIL